MVGTVSIDASEEPTRDEDGTASLAEAGFERSFRRRAQKVRALLALRVLLFGVSAGALGGALLTALAWWQRLAALRPLALPCALGVGVLASVWVALRRRWSDTDVALYLDAKLGASEAIVTAVEDGASEARSAAKRRAASALEARPARALGPRPLSRWHGALPVGSAAALWLAVIPLPPKPAALPAPPGAERVRLKEPSGLERIEALAEISGGSPAERERLKALAERAKKLREALAQGLEKREAQARIAKLRDDIAAEKLRFGDRTNRAGLDAAVSELSQKKITAKAARALGDGDITAFDAEMQRLASLAEKEDREAAKQALEEAERAAREKGANDLADALGRERKKLEEAEAKMDALRDLARRLKGALDEDGRRALGEANESGSPEAQRRLAEALDRALGKLSEEERQRLAARLQQDLKQGGDGSMSPMTREKLEDLAKRLGEKGAEQRLLEELRELARRDPSDDAERERGLGEAERGGSDAERALGAIPLPLGQSGSQAGPKQETAKDGKPGAGPGSSDDGGDAKHDGHTERLDVKELRSKTEGHLLPGAPMHRATLGRAPGRPGETANQVGTGELGSVGPTEVGAVEGADIPEEYREQVGRYFEP